MLMLLSTWLGIHHVSQFMLLPGNICSMARQIDWWNLRSDPTTWQIQWLTIVNIWTWRVDLLSMHIRLRFGQGNEMSIVVSVSVLEEINPAYKSHHGIPWDLCIPENLLIICIPLCFSCHRVFDCSDDSCHVSCLQIYNTSNGRSPVSTGSHCRFYRDTTLRLTWIRGYTLGCCRAILETWQYRGYGVL